MGWILEHMKFECTKLRGKHRWIWNTDAPVLEWNVNRVTFYEVISSSHYSRKFHLNLLASLFIFMSCIYALLFRMFFNISKLFFLSFFFSPWFIKEIIRSASFLNSDKSHVTISIFIFAFRYLIQSWYDVYSCHKRGFIVHINLSHDYRLFRSNIDAKIAIRVLLRYMWLEWVKRGGLNFTLGFW